MPTHKKTPAFIRVVTTENAVVCINPLQLSSFQILDQARVQVRGDKRNPKEEDYDLLPMVRFYFPSGTGLSYAVGVDITQANFDYICATLLEFLYLNEAEFKARGEAIKKQQMDEWNSISQENSGKIPEDVKV